MPNKPSEKPDETPDGVSDISWLDRIKNSPYTAVVAITSAIAVIVAVVAFSIIRDVPPLQDNKHVGTDNITSIVDNITVESLSDKPSITGDMLLQSIHGVLANSGVAEKNILENFFVVEGKTVYYINVNGSRDQLSKVHSGILDITSEYDVTLPYSDDTNHIILTTGVSDKLTAYRMELMLNEVATVEAVITTKGSIALLIDDAGESLELAKRLAELKVPITLAVLPHLTYSRQTAELIKNSGNTVFLHYPMEPLSYPSADPGEGAVLISMPSVLIQGVTEANIASLGGHVDGVNNHMGSAVTEDREKMVQVLDSIKPFTKVFVDSNTTNKSVAYAVCQELKMSCGVNKKFLDNSKDHEYIRSKLYEAAKQSDQDGAIIVIGHIRPDTVAVLEVVVPELMSKGYKFVSVLDVVK